VSVAPSSRRVFVAGATGTGKSHFLRRVLLPTQERAIILDFTGDFVNNRRELGGTVEVAETWEDVKRVLPRLAKRGGRWRLVTFLNRSECIELAGALVPERLYTGASIARAVGGCALVCDELSQFATHAADDAVLQLWRRGRHVGLSLLGASQAPTEVHPTVRGMSRYLVMFHLHEPNAVGYFERMVPAHVLEVLERLAAHECLVWDAERRVGYHLDAGAKVLATIPGR